MLVVEAVGASKAAVTWEFAVTREEAAEVSEAAEAAAHVEAQPYSALAEAWPALAQTQEQEPPHSAEAHSSLPLLYSEQSTSETWRRWWERTLH